MSDFLICLLFVVIVSSSSLLLFIYLFVQVVIPLIQESEWVHLPLTKETCSSGSSSLNYIRPKEIRQDLNC